METLSTAWNGAITGKMVEQCMFLFSGLRAGEGSPDKSTQLICQAKDSSPAGTDLLTNFAHDSFVSAITFRAYSCFPKKKRKKKND